MPFASISKVTSICGTPRGAGGMPVSSNLPSLRENEPVSLTPVKVTRRTPHFYKWLSFVIERSPSKTWINTAGWLSWYVEKVCDFFVGMTVFLEMSFVITPPSVSILRAESPTSGRGDGLAQRIESTA